MFFAYKYIIFYSNIHISCPLCLKKVFFYKKSFGILELFKYISSFNSVHTKEAYCITASLFYCLVLNRTSYIKLFSFMLFYNFYQSCSYEK